MTQDLLKMEPGDSLPHIVIGRDGIESCGDVDELMHRLEQALDVSKESDA
jgi:hypothetical protein